MSPTDARGFAMRGEMGVHVEGKRTGHPHRGDIG